MLITQIYVPDFQKLKGYFRKLKGSIQAEHLLLKQHSQFIYAAAVNFSINSLVVECGFSYEDLIRFGNHLLSVSGRLWQ